MVPLFVQNGGQVDWLSGRQAVHAGGDLAWTDGFAIDPTTLTDSLGIRVEPHLQADGAVLVNLRVTQRRSHWSVSAAAGAQPTELAVNLMEFEDTVSIRPRRTLLVGRTSGPDATDISILVKVHDMRAPGA